MIGCRGNRDDVARRYAVHRIPASGSRTRDIGNGPEMGSAVPMIIGTSGALQDEAARRFTVAFYRTLGEGDTVSEALRDGQDAVVL